MTLRADLQNAVRAYRALTFRGGIEGEVETAASELADEFNVPPQTSVIETRKYAYHRKIERNRTAAKQAKKFHGTRCQACELKFEERYGAIGKDFIEAHHLRRLRRWRRGSRCTMTWRPTSRCYAPTVTVLIHRSGDPSNLARFEPWFRQTRFECARR